MINDSHCLHDCRCPRHGPRPDVWVWLNKECSSTSSAAGAANTGRRDANWRNVISLTAGDLQTLHLQQPRDAAGSTYEFYLEGVMENNSRFKGNAG
ncbi:hypothetical protein J6590_024455 [Homalodisca vitripennis]|nr:hypothetical protein J6590_024455 [Homalodisca vitripennis]